jgi:phage tail sheath protein FI
MPQYLHPGVYVEEVPSAVRPIAGVGTSTAGFIGVFGDTIELAPVTGETIGTGTGAKTVFDLGRYPVATAAAKFTAYVNGTAVTGATLANNTTSGVSQVTLAAAPAAGAVVTIDYIPTFSPVSAGEVRLCTSFSDFARAFGDFSTDAGHRNLAHSVYGFFNNGGTRCYVVREKANGAIATSSLVQFEAIDEIAIVATPGIADSAVYAAVATHCRVRTEDRFAIFDTPEVVETANVLDLTKLDPGKAGNVLPQNSDYAALYFPWLEVYDPGTNASRFVPPSGHVAGIYARVDTERGVHKAPANEAVMGVTGLRYGISKAQQDGLNPQGVNVIMNLNGALRVFGARTLGGDLNTEFKYVNVRRLFLFLRESIDQGTQWVVFEPNDPSLWAKITRNVSAFLTNVWRDGALFGATPAEAFYVKCDAETNPPEVRDAGQVITEIGVAVVRPAEFVIFRISQWTGPGQ